MREREKKKFCLKKNHRWDIRQKKGRDVEAVRREHESKSMKMKIKMYVYTKTHNRSKYEYAANKQSKASQTKFIFDGYKQKGMKTLYCTRYSVHIVYYMCTKFSKHALIYLFGESLY